MGILNIFKSRGATIDKSAGIRRGSRELSKGKDKTAGFAKDGGLSGATINKDGFFVAKPGFKLSKRMIEENSALSDSIKAGN